MEYLCAHEQVRNGHSGFLFSDATELADLWVRLLSNPGTRRRLLASQTPPDRHTEGTSEGSKGACHNEQLGELHKELCGTRVTWEEQWERTMRPWLEQRIHQQL